MKIKKYLILIICIISAYFLISFLLHDSQRQIKKNKPKSTKSLDIKKSIILPKSSQKKLANLDVEKKIKENFVAIENLKILTSDLMRKVSVIENKDITPKILWYFFQLEDEIEEGKDFKKTLLRLKILTKKDKFLQDNLLELEKNMLSDFVNHKQLIQNLSRKISLLNVSIDDDSGLMGKTKSLIANYISIRKVKFSKEDANSLDYVIYNIEKSIKEYKYNLAIELLKKLNKEQKQNIGQEIKQLKKLSLVNKILSEIRFYLKDFTINISS